MKRKTLLWILSVLIIAAGIAGWSYVNRPAAKVEDATAIAVSAEELTTAYSSNEAAANKKYLNQAIKATGVVAEVSKNQDGKTVLLLQSEDPLSGVQCTLRDQAVVEPGKEVTVKGFCTGYTLVVLLSDCILL